MCSRPNPQENIPPMAERIARKGTSFYGQRHLCFLQHYRKVTYINLLMSVNLNEYLAKIDRDKNILSNCRANKTNTRNDRTINGN